MIRLDRGSLTQTGRFTPDTMSLNLSERGSTATITMAIGTEEDLTVGAWLLDDTDPGAGIVWRVKTIDTQYNTNTVTVQLEDLINSLNDQLLNGEITPATIAGSGATTCTAQQAIEYILGKQSIWTLDDFDYGSISNPYNFNGDTLKAAIETVSASLEDPVWTYDFTSFPFKLSITQASDAIDSEMRMSRNISTLKVSVDKTRMFTRFYPIGKNNLRLADPGYVEKNTSTYGVVEKTETDESKDTADKLTAWANERLDTHAEPLVTVTISGLDLSKATRESLDSFTIGKKCRVPLPEFDTTITEKVTKLSWRDKLTEPKNVTVTLANQKEDVASIINRLSGSSAKSARKNAKDKGDDHAWIDDTDEHVKLIAEAVAGKDGDGNPNWSRVSELTVDGNGIDARVTQAEGDIVTNATAITMTSTNIALSVDAAKSELHSVIELTVTGIMLEVANTASDIRSSITQTADGIRTDVSTASSAIYSVIEQTATSIRSEVANTASDLRSSIQQTAEGIRTDVSAASSSIYTVIEQTASAIRTEVANTESDIRSSITQTADSIRSDVSSTSSSIYSVIEQTATSIRSEVRGRARVYVQIADPAEQGMPVTEGDIWIKSLKVQSWDDFASHTWEDASSFDWKQYAGAPQFIWDGTRWEPIGDQGAISEYETEINQTNRKIELVARAISAIDPDAINLASLEITADAITAAVSTAKSELYSVVRQTATNIVSTVANTISDIRATVEQTAASITTSVSAAKSELYTTIMVTLTGIVQTVSSEIAESVIVQTSTSIYQAVAKKNRVFIQLSDPATNNTVIEGDIWIKSVGNNKLKPTWSELSASTWTSQNSTNWREYYEGYWYVRKNGAWSRMNANADVVEIGTFLEQDERQISLIARDVDENHQELGARLQVTAQEIRGEVHAAKSNMYSVVMQTATNVYSGVYNNISGNFSTIDQTASAIAIAVGSAKSTLFSSIVATAESINASVSSAKSALYSSIVATSTSIVSTVSSQVDGLSTTITQTKSQIALVVTKKDGQDVIDTASIVAGINDQTGSFVKIAAKTIDLSGYVKATSLTTDWLSALVADITAGTGKTFSFENLYANTFKFRSSAGAGYVYTDFKDLFVTSLSLSLSGNTYTLKSYNANATETVVGTFSRATSLSGSWSGRTHKVTASPQGNEMNTVISVYIPNPQGQPTASANAYVATGKSTAPYYETHGDAYPLHLVKSGLTVNLRNVNSSSGGVTYASTTCSDSNLKAANIKKDVSIFGVTGTYAGTTPQASNIQLYKDGVGDITRSTTAPTGNPLTSLATILKHAYQNLGGAGHYVKFPATINGGTGTKWFYIDMTP